ncbi:DUF2777 family protein [Alkalicoccus urumqiensis]|nr:DUF2777 family protein [Alkalicoccus urumqiensis]
MNRQEAHTFLGRHVLINEGRSGSYVGTLLDIESPAGSPWKGRVRIEGIVEAPDFNELLTGLEPLSYEKGEEVYLPGRAVQPWHDSFELSYRQSLGASLKERWDQASEAAAQAEEKRRVLQMELRKWQMEHLLSEDAYVYYDIVQKRRTLYIYDSLKEESLTLEGCPFEFELKVQNRWEPVYYSEGRRFVTPDGEEYTAGEGDKVRLNKEQFDPYKMLLNELETPAVKALERGLSKLKASHENCMHCHNSLLVKLLGSFEQQSFQGVNFITYETPEGTLMVQHHYERDMYDDRPDRTFDRFEFTLDDGTRMITSYSTPLSNDSGKEL